MTFDFFYISGSLVVPAVDHLNINKTKLYCSIVSGQNQELNESAK